MMTAVEGYYNGTNIVTDEKIPFRTGQKVIITILENPAMNAMQKLQTQMKDEAAAVGLNSEEDVADWIMESRKRENA